MQSQNGWSVITESQRPEALDASHLVPGVAVPNGIRRGDVATVLQCLALRFHSEVEPLIPGTCWGWYVKHIEGSDQYSNHSSGTAIDLNATRHPMGRRGTFTPAQQQIITRILRDLGGVVRWGGNYVGRPDEMHFEIVGTARQVGTIADLISGKGHAMDGFDQEDAREAASALLGTKLGRSQTLTVGIALQDTHAQVEALGVQGKVNGATLSTLLAEMKLTRGRIEQLAGDIAEIKALLQGLTPPPPGE